MWNVKKTAGVNCQLYSPEPYRKEKNKFEEKNSCKKVSKYCIIFLDFAKQFLAKSFNRKWMDVEQISIWSVYWK